MGGLAPLLMGAGAIAVTTYLTVNTLFFYPGMVPDLASARDRTPPDPKRRSAIGSLPLAGPGATQAGTETGHYGRGGDRTLQHGMGVNKTPWWRGEYSSTRVWLVGEAVWFAIGTTAGLGGAIHPVAPDFFTNIPSLEFGRIRQFHANMVLFGFVTAVLIGGGLYIVPRVLKRRLYSEATANLGALLFNSAALIGGIGILTGRTQGREYAEYVCSVDWLIVIAFILMGIVTVMTIVRREENLPYTSA